MPRRTDAAVKVVKRKDRKHFVLRWKEPHTGRWKEQTTDVLARATFRRKAERLAAVLEDQLEQDQSLPVTWLDFERRYVQEHLSGLSYEARKGWGTAAGHVQRTIAPILVEDVNASALSKLAEVLRRMKKSETTIAGYLRVLHAGLNWGARIGLIDKCPAFPQIHLGRGRSKLMRSRPVTGEEFDRMIAAVPGARPDDPERWKDFLTALWLSGLRLSEALRLSWNWYSDFALVLQGQRSQYRIAAEGEKGRRDRLLPVAPEFVEWLEERYPDPPDKGLVLDMPFVKDTVGRRISDIGKLARVVVSTKGKFASAHDLRRSFGTRWAPRLRPVQLQALMRHQNIETTLKYYVDLDMQELADELWKHVGDKSGDTSPKAKRKPVT